MKTNLFTVLLLCLVVLTAFLACPAPHMYITDPTPRPVNLDSTGLESLILSYGAVELKPYVYDYKLNVPDNIASIAVTPAACAGTRVIINDRETVSGSASAALTLKNGIANEFKITVIAADFTHYYYTLAVWRNSLKRQTVTYTNPDGSLSSRYVYEYDRYRRNTELMVYYADNSMYCDYFYEYNDQGQKIKATYFIVPNSTYSYGYYEYDAAGKLVYMHGLADANNMNYEYKYNAEGKQYQVFTYYGSNQDVTLRDTIYSTAAYTYNPAGKMEKYTIEYRVAGIKEQTDYFYNADNILTSYSFFSTAGVNYTAAYIYTTDAPTRINRIVYTNHPTGVYMETREYNAMGYQSKNTVTYTNSTSNVNTYDYEYYTF